MSFGNHSYKRSRALTRRLNLPVGHEVSVSAHRGLHKLMIDEGRVSEAQRKIDSRMDGRRALKGKCAHVQQPFSRFKKMPSSGRKLRSGAHTLEEPRVYSFFQLPDLSTE